MFRLAESDAVWRDRYFAAGGTKEKTRKLQEKQKPKEKGKRKKRGSESESEMPIWKMNYKALSETNPLIGLK